MELTHKFWTLSKKSRKTTFFSLFYHENAMQVLHFAENVLCAKLFTVV